VKVNRGLTLDDVGRELGDLGDWLSYVGVSELPGGLVPFVTPLGLFALGMIALVAGVFLYWCVSDWRHRWKSHRAYWRRRTRSEVEHGRDAAPQRQLKNPYNSA
jgi:hypothetical protein